MKARLLLYILFTFFLSSAHAQDASTLYRKASEAFDLGRFQEVDSLLGGSAELFKGEYLVGAYRMLALSSLYQDDEEGLDRYVSKLLMADPYYTAYGENPRFSDAVETKKRGKSATITTASQQAETIEEAPVPVTLITEQMLRNIGARTLKEALIAYVPGMTDIASNEEMNIAMRGVYSSSQEKILILLNGHRLNSYSTNAATPDFSMSLEKVKQIEVLRGPASSIYGGVALTGVVNVITKDGGDVDGLRAKISAGNYGQLKGDLLFGKRYMGLDILTWGSIYNATGQRYYSEGTPESQPYAMTPHSGMVTIDGYNNKPSFDFGVKLNLDNLHFLYNYRFSKSVAPLSFSGFHAPYSYSDFRRLHGNLPGFAIGSQHAELGYGQQKAKWSWDVSAYLDAQSQQRYQVGGDTIGFDIPAIYIWPYFGSDPVPYMSAPFQSISWHEYTVGLHARGGYNYAFGRRHKGTVTFGAHASRFSLYDWEYVEGVQYNRIVKTYDDEKTLDPGAELMADAYVQIKHQIGDSWLFNLGARTDYKHRASGTNIYQVSPRLAVIFNQPKYDVKLSYAKSFVDAPYFYRNNTLDVDFGLDDLEPEKMHSFQLSFYSDNKLVKGLMLDVNVFFNQVVDVIRKIEEITLNTGRLDYGGIELASRYTMPKLSVETNLTLQKVISYSEYDVLEGMVLNVPTVKWNTIVSYKPIRHLCVHGNLNVLSSQQSIVINPLFVTATQLTIPSRAILNLGAYYQFHHFDLSFNVNNVLNQKYTQGGSSYAPLRQQGLWFIGSIAYKL